MARGNKYMFLGAKMFRAILGKAYTNMLSCRPIITKLFSQQQWGQIDPAETAHHEGHITSTGYSVILLKPTKIGDTDHYRPISLQIHLTQISWKLSLIVSEEKSQRSCRIFLWRNRTILIELQ